MSELETLSARFAELRKIAGVDLETISNATGISVERLKAFEENVFPDTKYGQITTGDAMKIVKGFRVFAGYLMTSDSKMITYDPYLAMDPVTRRKTVRNELITSQISRGRACEILEISRFDDAELDKLLEEGKKLLNSDL